VSDDAHACGAFDGVKKAGSCLCCAAPTYEIRDVHPDGPLAGHPRRVGAQLPHGVQVAFLLSDGSEADVSFCVPCARALTPASYQRAWAMIIRRVALAADLSGRRALDRRLAIAPFARVFPIAVLRWRREDRELNRLVVDPRRKERAA
jgi:hypothetical protein